VVFCLSEFERQHLWAVAKGSDRASDALEPGGRWNAYVCAIAGFMSEVAPENISAADYSAYDDASTGRNWNLPMGYGTLVAASLPPLTASRLATPAERIDLTPDGVAVVTRSGTVRAGAAILTVSTAVLAGDAIRLPPWTEPWREAAAALPLGRNEKVLPLPSSRDHERTCINDRVGERMFCSENEATAAGWRAA